MTRSRASALAVLALALAPASARADRSELYLEVRGAPSYLSLTDPVERTASISIVGGGLGLAAFYGLTNTLHFGVAANIGMRPNAAFVNHQVTIRDEQGEAVSRPPGDLYSDLLSLSASAILHYRMDWPAPLAPFGRLELGAAWSRASRVVHYISGTPLQATFDDASELSPTLAAQVGLEWRVTDSWIATAAISLRYIPPRLDGARWVPALVPLELNVPLGVAYVF